MVCIETLRSDINEVGEYEVTATSELHAQAERAKMYKREERNDGVYSKRRRHPVRVRGTTPKKE